MPESKEKSTTKRIDLLLTRPELESERLANLLDKKKFRIKISPLIEINSIDYKFEDTVQYDLIIFTSKNGINNFQYLKKDDKVLVIGDGTNELAKKKGISNIKNVKGNSKDLKNRIRKFIKKGARILHPTSIDLNNELKIFFKDLKCSYTSLGCYNSNMCNSNPEVFENFFNSCKDGLITLFSRRTALSLKNEIFKMNLSENCKYKRVLVLSSSIEHELNDLNFKEVHKTNEPNEESMIKLIENLGYL